MVRRDPPRLLLSFVTSNVAKAAEATVFLRPRGIELRPIIRQLPEPQADDLRTVALAKLDSVPEIAGAVFVEDSGLFVDALGGFPGVYSSYAYRTLGIAGLLRLLEGQPRGAEFRTVAGLRVNGAKELLTGSVRGEIATAPRGSNGFGYDPVFQPEHRRETFAEMALAEKSALSHRARAMAAVATRLRELSSSAFLSAGKK